MQNLCAKPIHPAKAYRSAKDFCAVTCLFNVGNSTTKLNNFHLASLPFEAGGMTLFVIECVTGNAPFALPNSAAVIQVRTQSNLWQKERLLNLAIKKLAPQFGKIAWIDSDILFENPNWAEEASAMLDHVGMVQLFDQAIRMPRGQISYSGEGTVWEGFAAVYHAYPNALLCGDFAVHGHTGFAWAARTEILSSTPLYDAAVAGGGDHVMAHAFCGDWDSPCLTRMMSAGSAWHEHASAWGRRIYPLVQGRVSHLPGAILHLWHGELGSRRHVERFEALRANGFDPQTDLRPEEGGCWQWASDKPGLHDAVSAYLLHRQAEAMD